MTRVLVCGGRDYDNRERLFAELDRLHAQHKFSVVIHGAAPGADTLADEWAKARGIPPDPYPANWDKYGNAAGGIRNSKMLRLAKPEMVVAFPTGGPGTADMMRKAKAVGIIPRVFR